MEEQVKGFSCLEHRGYTIEEGGRARAERDFHEYCRKASLKKGAILRFVCRDSEQSKKSPTSPFKEPIRVYVSGHMGPSPTAGRCVAPQLQTPSNTLIGKKKERSPSWQAEDEARKKAVYVNNDDIRERATGLKSEQKHIYIKSQTTLSAKASIYDLDDCSIKDSRSAGALPQRADCGDIASDTSSDDPNSGDYGSDRTSLDGHSPCGNIAGEADLNGQVPLTTEREYDNDASTTLINNRGYKNHVAGEEIYPQLPVSRSSKFADLNEVTSHDRIDLPKVTLNHFSPALDHIPFKTPYHHDDFVEDAAVLDRISANGPRTEPRLCAEQLALVELIMSDKNVFYTGSAGCGKSTVLKHFVPLLRNVLKKVDILAPTGKAALEVNDRTLHNYAGWVPHSFGQPLWNLENKARGNKVRKRLRATDVLIIDEISMVANHVFERLNCIMKSARDSKKPFGGVQIIVTGDFLQLPPVNPFEYCLICGITLGPASWEGKHECVKCLSNFEAIDKWAFCSDAWRECNFEHVNLNVIHRQKDIDFKALLETCRLCKPFSIGEKLLLLEHTSETKDAVRLSPRRVDVKAINDEELAKLPGRALTYLCVDNFYWNGEDALKDKRDRCPEPMSHTLEALNEYSFEPKLVLKEGMLVMLLVNWDLGSSLANGSQGTVVGFEKYDPNLFPEVRRDWEYSSRKNGLVRVFVKQTAVQEWPIVQFLNGIKRTIYPLCMVNELGDDEPYSLLSRTQIPLVAAWAMTVHKAQGMTLSRVIVDLRHSFESGQAYVALSRAETLGGLKVEGLPKEDRGPNKQVIEFMEKNHLISSIDMGGCTKIQSPPVSIMGEEDSGQALKSDEELGQGVNWLQVETSEELRCLNE